MKQLSVAVILACLVACGSKKQDPPQGDDKASADVVASAEEDAAVDFARKQVPELDKMLASDDPGQASSTCSVIKPDMAKIEKADPELAATLKTRCGRDLAVRSLAVHVERAEKDASECSEISIYDKMITKAGVESDPEVVKLHERVAAACKKDE